MKATLTSVLRINHRVFLVSSVTYPSYKENSFIIKEQAFIMKATVKKIDGTQTAINRSVLKTSFKASPKVSISLI